MEPVARAISGSARAAGVRFIGRRDSVFALSLIVLGATACKREAPKPQPVAAVVAQAKPPRFRTTSGELAVGSLDGQIRTAEKALARTGDIAVGAQLVDLYGERAQFLGTLEDYDRALALSAQLVRDHPNDGAAHLARASALNCLHRFGEVLTELDLALAEKAKADSVELLRASTYLAMGRSQEAADIFAKANQRYPRLRTLGDEGMARAELGDAPRARGLFQQALQHYRDVSPFPVAWVDFHEAMVEEKLGHTTEAMAFYGDAVARLPEFAAAQGHLAALEAATGKPAQAVARLRGLTRSSDPEFLGQLAALLPPAEAAPMVRTVAARFDVLLASHPEAYADHAARFWLGPGGDAKKALALAQKNLLVRQTAEAYELALEAALASKDQVALCPLAEAADKLAASSVPLEVALERAFKACGKPDRAKAEAQRLEAVAD